MVQCLSFSADAESLRLRLNCSKHRDGGRIISKAYKDLSKYKNPIQTSNRSQSNLYEQTNPCGRTALGPFLTIRIASSVPTTARRIRRAAILVTVALRRTGTQRRISRRRRRPRPRSRIPSRCGSRRRIDAILARPLTYEARRGAINTACIAGKIAANVVVIVGDGSELNGQTFNDLVVRGFAVRK